MNISALTEHHGFTRPLGAEKLVGGAGEWRVRTGDYRIVDEIDDGALVILVLAVGHRWEVYQRR